MCRFICVKDSPKNFIYVGVLNSFDTTDALKNFFFLIYFHFFCCNDVFVIKLFKKLYIA